MFIREFEIRWSDLDANRHLANSAYINFTGHTRVSFLQELGFSLGMMQDRRIGPVVFYEHIYYFKEVLPGKPIRISLEVKGMSADGMFFEFHHNFYDHSGQNIAHYEMMGAWISLETRGLTGLDDDLLELFNNAEKPEGFRVLARADTRRHAKKPAPPLGPS